MANMFRLLRADEIECRVKIINEKGLSLLLYKDARCDQNILDETVGAMNWQKSYSRENANCAVSIWDPYKEMWIFKEDTGTESKTEAEKGLASDSFKRACFNWGIGRELYTAPFIWVRSKDCVIKMEGQRYICKDRFFVKDIEYENEKISGLVISAMGEKESESRDVFKYSTVENEKRNEKPQKTVLPEDFITDRYVTELRAYADEYGLSEEKICAGYNIKDFSELNIHRYKAIINPDNLNELKQRYGK